MVSVAIAVGASLVSAGLNYLLTPKPDNRNALDDLSVLKSELGVNIPKIYGRQRVTGNVIWATDLREEERRDGNRYYADWAVLLCEGEIEDIGRVWLENKLVADNLSTDPATIAASQQFINKHLNIHYGTFTQNPDPEMELREGVGNVPAFRGRAYIVVRNLNLRSYGNRIPKMEVEIIAKTAPTTLAEAINGACLKGKLDLAEFNTTALGSQEISGAILSQGGESVRDFIEELQRCYHFIIRESQGVVSFIPIEQLTIWAIDPAALGTKEDSEDLPDLYTEIREQVVDLPSEVQIEYSNIGNAYKRGHQTAYRSTATHENQVNFRTSVVLTDSQALTAVTKTLGYYWTQRRRYEGIRLPLEYLDMQPGDLIDLPVRNSIVRLQIQKMDIGANLIIEVEGVTYSTTVNQLSLTAPTDNDYTPVSSLPFYGDPDTITIDTNLVRDNDTELAIYASADPDPDWDGGTLYFEPQGGDYTPDIPMSLAAAQGTLSTAIPSSNEFVVDTTTKFTVVLSYGTLTNITDAAFYNLTQVAYVNGELIGFKNANLIAANTYEISTLIRGARGTESFIATHAIASNFYLISSFYSSDITVGQLGTTVNYKSVPSEYEEDDVTNEASLSILANRLKPYAPTQIKLTKKTNDDILISWERRTRKFGDWLESSETVPLNEDSEVYRLIIRNGITIVRDLTVTTNSYTYTASMQTTDFGSTQSILDLTIAQKSAIVGDGYYEIVDNKAIDLIEV